MNEQTTAFNAGSTEMELLTIFVDKQVLILDLEHLLGQIFPNVFIKEISSEILNQKKFVQREQLNIVFAEDSPTMRKAMMKQLQTAGFENIKAFVDGEKAFSHLVQNYQNNGEKSCFDI